MPTIATRAAASARGYGFAGIKLNVVSQTFTSSTTWVAPATVTNLLAVIGKGQDGVGDYQGNATFSQTSITNSATGSGANSLPISGAAAGNLATASTTIFNAGGYVRNTTIQTREFTFFPTNTYNSQNFYPAGTSGFYPYFFVAGTWSAQGGPYSGNLNYGSTGYYYSSGDIIYPGYGGASTTGFGFTFSGGGISGTYPDQVGEGATPASYTNVAVTPGASYSLSIPDGGYITIQYLSA